jgi:hypothetical protein
MLPPGMSFNALSPKALAASKSARLPKAFWAWDEIVEMNKGGYWPYTPNTNLLYGLHEALDMLLDSARAWSAIVCPPPALGRGRARGRAGLGSADPVRRRWRLFTGADRRDHARGGGR